jgi:hypothetical protein
MPQKQKQPSLCLQSIAFVFPVPPLLARRFNRGAVTRKSITLRIDLPEVVQDSVEYAKAHLNEMVLYFAMAVFHHPAASHPQPSVFLFDPFSKESSSVAFASRSTV